MKRKEFLILLILILCVLIPRNVFADNDRGVTFSATVEPEYITPGTDGSEVKVYISADKEITVDGYSMDLPFPSGWSIVSISNTDLEMTNDDYVLKLKSGNLGRILWQDPESRSVPTVNLAVVTYRVPADTKAGIYSLKATDFELTDGGGDIWETGASVSFDIVVKGGTDDPQPIPWEDQSEERTDPAEGDPGRDDLSPGEDAHDEASGGEDPADQGKGDGQSGKDVSEPPVWPYILGILIISIVIYILTGKKKKKKAADKK